MRVFETALILSLSSSLLLFLVTAFESSLHGRRGLRISHKATSCNDLRPFSCRHVSSSVYSTSQMKMMFGMGNDGSKSNGNVNNDPHMLLKMVEDLTMAVDDVTPELMNKMEKVEIALATFLEENSIASQQQDNNKPPPPAVPPPMRKLYSNPDMLSNDLMRAEQALEKLRERLRQEEQALFQAEQVLQRSLEEQDILRQAEEALQKSRDAAERRRNGFARPRGQQSTAPPLPPKQDVFGFTKKESSPQSRARPTMELGNLFGGNRKSFQRTSTAPPEGIPILYNWTQGSDGSIKGKIGSSPNFADGATISTSAVALGAVAGTVVSTASGSQYYLEEASSTSSTLPSGQATSDNENPSSSMRRATLPMFQNNGKKSNVSTSKNDGEHNPLMTAPNGVPSIRNWKVRDDGGISGLIYGSVNAEDGDYIETRTIATGQLENGHIVETLSGSRYFLSAESADNISTNIMNAFKSLSGANKQTGTITITKNRTDKEQNRRNAESAMKALENSPPRSTFSLFDLFGSSSEPKVRQPQPSPPPPPRNVDAPDGVPILSSWSVNNDGTITGYVYGSGKIGDGNLVTTSLIASGVREQFSTVATVSGSVYFLA